MDDWTSAYSPLLRNEIMSLVSCWRNAIVSSALKQNIILRKKVKEEETNDELRRVQENCATDIPRRQKPWKIRNVQECAGMFRNDGTPEYWSESRNIVCTA